jgi:hypothetical protein
VVTTTMTAWVCAIEFCFQFLDLSKIKLNPNCTDFKVSKDLFGGWNFHFFIGSTEHLVKTKRKNIRSFTTTSYLEDSKRCHEFKVTLR